MRSFRTGPGAAAAWTRHRRRARIAAVAGRLVLAAALFASSADRSLADADGGHAGAIRRAVPSGQVMDALRAAVAAGDDERVRELAALPVPSRFEVAERMLFPLGARGPSDQDRSVLERYARFAPAGAGVRAFIAHWLAADAAAFEIERGLWRVTARMTMAERDGDAALALQYADEVLPSLDGLPHSSMAPRVRRGRVRSLVRLGRFDEAESDIRRSIDRLCARGWHAEAAVARSQLLAVVEDARDYPTYLRESTTAERSARDLGDWLGAWRVVSRLARVATDRGEFGEAERSCLRAAAIADAAGLDKQARWSRLQFTDVLRARGEFETSNALRRRLLHDATENDDAEVALAAAVRLVDSDLSRGRVADALRVGEFLAEQGVHTRRRDTQSDIQLLFGRIAELRGDAAGAYGRYVASMRHARQVFRDATRLSRAFEGLIRVRATYGEHVGSGDGEDSWTAVLAQYRESARRAARGIDTPSALAAWSALELRLGNVERAQRLVDEARAALDLPEASRHAAAVALAAGDIDARLRRWDEVLRRTNDLSSPSRARGDDEVRGLELRARALIGLERWPQAVDVLRQATRARQHWRSGLGTRDAGGLRAWEHSLVALGARAALRWHEAGGGEPALEAVWWFRENAGARLLVESVRQRGTGGGGPADSEVLAALDGVEAAHRDQLEATVAGDAEAQRAAAKRLAAAHREFTEITARRQRARRNRTVDGSRLHGSSTLADVQASLPTGTAILAYAVGDDAIVGIAICRDSVVARAIDDRAGIERLLGSWCRLASTPRGPDRKLAGRLFDRIVAPFDGVLRGSPRWIVMPDGAMATVPFDALVRSTDEGERRLIEDHALQYAHGFDALSVLRQRSAARGDAARLVAVGDPAYAPPTEPPEDAAADAVLYGASQEIAALRGGVIRLARLPSSRSEAETVASMYPESERALLLGENATRDGLLHALGADEGVLDCVHLACHGVVDDRIPELSGLAFAGGELLTAERIQHSRIPTELAVLSACRSSGETVAAGEGVVGLTRSFLVAGATRVLCTTWQVADGSTARLMSRFHRARRADGARDVDALRSARLALLRGAGTGHPYHWAGFQLWGAVQD